MKFSLADDEYKTLVDELTIHRNRLREGMEAQLLNGNVELARKLASRSQFIGTILHDLEVTKGGEQAKDPDLKDRMLKVANTLASMVHTVATSQFFTKQLWKDVYPDMPASTVLSIFITHELYNIGVYAHYGPMGLMESDLEHIRSFLDENSAVLKKYTAWSLGGQR